ncbi:MAG: antitoxin [Roseococcus sp.]|nr:antitoxin [Roseococcus sp.]
MARLTIDITDRQHQALKAMAAIQGKTIKAYAVERLFPPSDSEAQAFSALKALLEQRLGEAQRGEVSARTITEIAQHALRADGAA